MAADRRCGVWVRTKVSLRPNETVEVGWETVLFKGSKLAPLRGVAGQQVSPKIRFSPRHVWPVYYGCSEVRRGSEFQEQPPILRLTTPKLNSAWGPRPLLMNGIEGFVLRSGPTGLLIDFSIIPRGCAALAPGLFSRTPPGCILGQLVHSSLYLTRRADCSG